jgi:hypothetical protein
LFFCGYNQTMPKIAKPIPRGTPSIIAIIIQIIMATADIISAFIHPVSKKCLAKASHMNNTIMVAIIPEKKYEKIPQSQFQERQSTTHQ